MTYSYNKKINYEIKDPYRTKKELESPYNKIKRIVVVEIFPEILF